MNTTEERARLENKRRAAERAVALVGSGMVVGLGSGSTAIFAIRKLAARLNAGELEGIAGVPSSIAMEREAKRLGLPLTTLGEPHRIDLTIDGADEVDPQLNLIKGGGGALLREKILAEASEREVIVVDESKLSPRLGSHRSVPVEVLPFGWRLQMRFLEELGARVVRRVEPDGSPYKTDQGNMILDSWFGPIEALHRLAQRLSARAGIVEHGLFLHLATDLIVAGDAGVRHVAASVGEPKSEEDP